MDVETAGRQAGGRACGNVCKLVEGSIMEFANVNMLRKCTWAGAYRHGLGWICRLEQRKSHDQHGCPVCNTMVQDHLPNTTFTQQYQHMTHCLHMRARSRQSIHVWGQPSRPATGRQ